MTPKRVRSAASVAVALAVWEILGRRVFASDAVPPPSTIFATAGAMLASGELLHHVAISLKRVVVGYVVGAACGIVIGVLMGRLRWCFALFDPPIQLMKSISPVAIVPLAIIWFGIGENSKYFVIGYIVVIIMALQTQTGVRLVPPIKVRAAQCLGAHGLDLFRRLIVPAVVPYVLGGLRIALGFAFMSVVAAEIIAANSGIGFLIMDARTLVQTDRMFVGLLTLGILGFAVNAGFRLLVDRSRTLARFDLDKLVRS